MTDPLLAALAGRNGPAVVTPTRDWSWEELREAAGDVADTLTEGGVRAGDRVVVEATLSAETIPRLLAARMLGAVVLPADPRTLTARVVLTGPRAVLRADGSVSWREPAVPAQPAGAWAVATSGTTGSSRVAVLTPSGVDHVARSVAGLLDLRPADRILTPLPLHHTYGLSQLWLAVHTGATLVLPASTLPGDLAAALREGDVVAGIPATVRALLSAAPGRPPRLVTLAGQACSLAERATFAGAWPTTRFVCFYGLTEATTRVTWLPPEAFRDDVTGVPIPGVEVRLADDGELLVRGPNVFAGYLDDPAATAERLRDGWLATGDLFEHDGDRLRFLGRRDTVFKRLGEKVVPEMVEAVLNAHPAIARALVLPMPTRGEELAPVAWIVPHAARPAPAELSRWLRQRLPPASVPTAVHEVSALPLTPTGKLVRRVPPEGLS